MSSAPARKRTMDALASCDDAMLARGYAALGDMPEAVPVRGPEVGMVMLRGRIGGGGAPFNIGEATVTRATVRLATGEVGHAMILGQNADKARMCAHLDAVAQRAEWAARVEATVVAPALAATAEDRTRRSEETEATRVDFFTLVRGED